MPAPGEDRFFTELRGCTAELARITGGDLERPVPAAGALPGLGPRPVHRESQDHISVCEVTAAPAG